MKPISILKGLYCALLILLSNSALADWDNVAEDVSVSQSRARYVRTEGAYVVQVTITNNSAETLQGPFRLLIPNTTLAVIEPDGLTSESLPYFDLLANELASGSSMSVTAKFTYDRRTSLVFDTALQSDADTSNWTMVWNDEFDGAQIDTSKWGFEVNCWGGGNGEQQCYTDRPVNSWVDNGVLTIKAQRETFTGPAEVDGDMSNTATLPYTSARLRTMNKGDWKYGRFEIRAKLPSGQGTWPAIWMLPTDYVYGGWAASGEIDIMEAVNLKANSDEAGVPANTPESRTHGTLHFGKTWPGNVSSGAPYKLPDGLNPADDFHEYALEWEKGEIRWYVDGVHFATQRETGWYSQYTNEEGLTVNGEEDAPFNQRFHMLLNLAVGGAWAGNVNEGGIDESVFPQTMQVDYVRVYECSVNPNEGTGCASIGDNPQIVEGHQPPEIVNPETGFGQEAVFNLYIDQLADGLTFESYNPEGSITISEQAEEGHGNVVNIDKTTATGNVFFAYPPVADLSRWQEFGVLTFDLKVNSADPAAELLVKLDSGWPAVSDYSVTLPATGEWAQVRIPIADIAAGGNRYAPGNFVDLTQVVNPFVVEPTAAMNFTLDNVRYEFDLSHNEVATIFDEQDHTPFGINKYVANGSVDIEQVAAADGSHGQVKQITFNTNESVVYFQTMLQRDLTPLKLDVSAFSYVEFDLNVVADPRADRTFMAKMDCGSPCGSGDYPIAAPDIGVWTHYKIPVVDLVNNPGSSLNVFQVDTPLVVFPAWGNQQGVIMQVDNVQLTKGGEVVQPPPVPTDELVLFDEATAQGWSLWDCCANASLIEVNDPDGNHGQVIKVDFYGPVGTVSGLFASSVVDLTQLTNGTLEFDLKLVNPPTDTSALILLKVEALGGAFAQLELNQSDEGQDPQIGQWQHFTYQLSDLAAAGLDLSQVKIVMIFPEWGKAQGAIYHLDNVIFTSQSAAVVDSDNDGIDDTHDQCANTPPNSPVDVNGCVLVVSTDSDGDGVEDSIDQCADTESSVLVDDVGCPVVTTSLTGIVQDDDDSVYFYVNTTGWADVHYTINGGGQLNVRMENVNGRNIFSVSGLSDGDEIIYWFTYLRDEGGATDSNPSVFTLGDSAVTDEDNDGVSDSTDQCAGTDQGVAVDEVGCPLDIVDDEDGDGIADEFDQCLGTDTGVAVDAVGCALPDYGDEDSDGVTDDLDQCLGTEEGVSVDAFGCEVIPAVHEVSSANNILVGGSGSSRNGFTLYVFDNDNGTDGSVCNAGCQENWPPLLVTDGNASGIAGLSTITRSDGSIQATHQGRPLYFYTGDTSAGETAGEGLGGVWWTVEYAAGVGDVIPLFHENTPLEQAISYDRGDALVTRFADRGRDRHAKEDQFQIYDHYLSHYWTHRTARFQFEDYVAKGGETIDVTFISEWKLGAREFRVWYRGLNTVAEYHGNLQTDSQWPVTEEGPGTWDNDFNKVSDSGVQYKYTTKITKYQGLNWQPTDPVTPLAIGQRMELEVSQFLDGQPEGRSNYYGTTYLYIIGQGMVPWKTVGDFDDKSSEREDSYPIATQGWLGGTTTLPYNYTNEPDNHFMQMATNLSHVNGQPFVLGRRLFHTNFANGQHDESPENGVFDEMAGKAGNHYINASCAGCHERNGRAAPVAEGLPLDKWVFQVGDADGNPDPYIGRILQPKTTDIGDEGSVSIEFWTEENGLRSPNYQFSQATPATFSARIAPQLVGIGLLEAIPESTILAMEDVNDLDNDGISGRAQRSTDPETGDIRLGRFGWKAAKVSIRHQIAAALNTDIGVTTSVLPEPDCGSEQDSCGSSGIELDEQHLQDLVKYTALLGVRAQRDLDNPLVQQGKQLFSQSGCAGCHTPTLQTSEYHPFAELRDQTIHPYTDMLLHDMGPGLADNLGEDQATGAEWRTTPLWGIGLSACVTGGVINPVGGQGNEVCDPDPSYLHDGRARSIEEAILWHGGEAEVAKSNYQNLSAGEKTAVLSFLDSL
ncbi:di-heme oxidoredictase family protein [Neptunicella sp. SCSIO 80796]|uniref:di-heme oxidoredictase family protein n=1 Tax=Neptunicella plasticusilytica TaxID=3117012 RepID=UPI003A4D8FC3